MSHIAVASPLIFPGVEVPGTSMFRVDVVVWHGEYALITKLPPVKVELNVMEAVVSFIMTAEAPAGIDHRIESEPRTFLQE